MKCIACRILICAAMLLLVVFTARPMPSSVICKLEAYPYPGPAVYQAKTGTWYDLEPDAWAQLTISDPKRDPTLRQLRANVCDECAHKLLDLSGSLFLYVPDMDYLAPLSDDIIMRRKNYCLLVTRLSIGLFTVTCISTK